MSGSFPELLDDWLEGTLAGERAAAFAALLAEDPERREEARVALRLRRMLPLALADAAADAFTRGVLHDLRPQTGRFAARTLASIRPSQRVRRRAPRRASGPWPRLGASALAAGILAVVAVLLTRPAASSGASSDAIVARVDSGLLEVADRLGAWRALNAGATVVDGERVRVRARGGLRSAAGSSILLETGAEIRIAAGATAPRVTLVDGACFISTVASDRGLIVTTRHGTMRAIGTRFGVAASVDETIVGVVAGTVEAGGAGAPLLVEAGRLARVSTTAGAIPGDPSIRFSWATGVGGNQADALVNLALLPQTRLSGSVPPGEVRGSLREILFDPASGAYVHTARFNEYGAQYEAELGVVGEDAPFHWTAEWPQPLNINCITVGGSYANQPQPDTGWAVSYRIDGRWRDLARGRGGWIDDGIFAWGGPGHPPIVADAVRVAAFSVDGAPLHSVHLRARGGVSQVGDEALGTGDDRAQPVKATLIQFLPSP